MFLTWVMDSDHSSASNMDVLKSDLDSVGTDMDFPSAPATDDSAAPSAATPSSFRRCAYGRRMSCKAHDHHVFFVYCRGFECNFNSRCDECKSLTDGDFQTYLRHQKSLKRKSLSKQRARARAADAASVAPPVLSPLVSPSASVSGEGVVHDVDVQDQLVVHEPQTSVSLDQLKDLLGLFSRSFDENLHNCLIV